MSDKVYDVIVIGGGPGGSAAATFLAKAGKRVLVTGAGGKLRRGDVDENSTITAAGYDKDNHFMLIELDDREMKFKAITETGDLIDSGALK